MSKKTLVVDILLFAAGAGIGYGVGYYLAKKRTEKYIDQEIESVKDAYFKRGAFVSPESAAAELIGEPDISEAEEVTEDAAELEAVAEEIAEDNGYFTHVTEEKPQIENIWDKLSASKGKEEPEEEAEELEDILPDRDPDHPYVISYETFMSDEMDDKVSLVYFEGDDQLTDEQDDIVPNAEQIVGEKNLTQFGLGSHDKNAVYIRNERMRIDIEVIRDRRTYQEVVLGVTEPKLKKSPLKMRDDDD